jgi:hypothetical protein
MFKHKKYYLLLNEKLQSMDTVLSNVAAVASMQLSMNGSMAVNTGNMNLTYKRATAASLSQNATNFTRGSSSATVPDLCALLDQTDCENTPFVSQVNRLIQF